MSELLEFGIFRSHRGSSVGAYVAEVVRLVEQNGAAYRTTAMGTIIETDTLAGARALVEQASRVLEERRCRPAYGAVTFDSRPGREQGMTDKIESVRRHVPSVNA